MGKKTTTRIKKTGIDKAVMAQKSILIFGMNENGEVSENYEKMINEHGELFRLKRLAMRSEPGNMYYRNNRNGDIKYFVFIYGNIEQTFNAVNRIVDKIKEEKLSDYHIYMEKIESDTYDIAKAMLEKSGLSMDYFVRGEEKKKTEPEMKFPIDFKPKQMLDNHQQEVIAQDLFCLGDYALHVSVYLVEKEVIYHHVQAQYRDEILTGHLLKDILFKVYCNNAVQSLYRFLVFSFGLIRNQLAIKADSEKSFRKEVYERHDLNVS